MSNPIDRARSDAARLLFIYIYNLRHNSRPASWEIVLGQALLTGELQVVRAPETELLRRIHHVAEDVALAMQVPELLGKSDG